MPKIFSSVLSGFNVISKKKKKKKKVLRLSSATFLRVFCDVPERGAVNHSCLWFLAGNKNAGFWREKKRRNLQNFSAKMPEKISHFSHFFALIGNTDVQRKSNPNPWFGRQAHLPLLYQAFAFVLLECHI